MSLTSLSLALALSATPLAPSSADLSPAITATEQAASPAAVQPVALPPASLPPCPQGAALPSADAAPTVPGDGTPSAPADDNAIVVTARPESEPGDPMLQLNAQSYEVVQDVDEALVGPVAMAYKDAIPKPLRHGLRNFLRNLTEPIVALNFLLQLKPGKAAETVGRFAINTTIGIGGLFDLAKRDPFNLPYRRNGFANTLGYYGVEPGAYLFLPLIGPTTVRDLVGGTIDGLLLPTVAGAPFNDPYFTLPAATLSALQGRIQIDEQLNALRTYSNDPYVDARDFYLKRRQAEIDALRGRVAYPDADLPFVNPGTGGPVVMPVTPIAPMTSGVDCVPVGGF
ncbi:MlaA family lipoprotein [Blastomonas sp.]|uniref:MlaA family lipoprotein n=1 Tax=Blastomonas sp. TaxID=1909299 RepID=UPI002619A26C|nr:MlaA family lipoprotein [Blastomonas sp.]MDM7957991.1 MlaA family lipoprotein [Blastomonas sp.]